MDHGSYPIGTMMSFGGFSIGYSVVPLVCYTSVLDVNLNKQIEKDCQYEKENVQLQSLAILLLELLEWKSWVKKDGLPSRVYAIQ